MKMNKAIVLVLVLVALLLAGCDEGSTSAGNGATVSAKFTVGEMLAGLQAQGIDTSQVTATGCVPAPINGGDGTNFDYCDVWFSNGAKAAVSKSAGQWVVR